MPILYVITFKIKFLAIMPKIILNEIASEVRQAGDFATIADESKDCIKTEQLSAVLRDLLHINEYESFCGICLA